jgi:hypothetical protein
MPKNEREEFIPTDETGDVIPSGVITPEIIELVATIGRNQAPVEIQTVKNQKEWGEDAKKYKYKVEIT